MKALGFCLFLLTIYLPVSCQRSPAAMPADFSVGIYEQGGLTGLSTKTIISLDSCIKEDRHADTVIRREEWKVTASQLETLYKSLLELGSFNIRSLAYHGRLYDGGSLFIAFTVNGKNYSVHSSASNRILHKDLEKYHETVRLLNGFVSSRQKDIKGN